MSTEKSHPIISATKRVTFFILLCLIALGTARAGKVPKVGEMIKFGEKIGVIFRKITREEAEKIEEEQYERIRNKNFLRDFAEEQIEKLKKNKRRRHAPNIKTWRERLTGWFDKGKDAGETVTECGCWGADYISNFPKEHNCKNNSVFLVVCSNEICPPEQISPYPPGSNLYQILIQYFPEYGPYRQYGWICGTDQ